MSSSATAGPVAGGAIPAATSIPPITGRRKSLHIGINYIGHKQGQLSGCINDVHNVQKLLGSKFGFSVKEGESTRTLTDDNAKAMPTRANIIAGCQWLLEDAKPGDSLFFQYSGHGSQVTDSSGDEADGKDETIVPCDYQTAGMIVDDDLYRMLVAALPAGVQLFALMDCCHSGTGLDLPYLHDVDDDASGDAASHGDDAGKHADDGGGKKKKDKEGKDDKKKKDDDDDDGGKKKKDKGGKDDKKKKDRGSTIKVKKAKKGKTVKDTSTVAGIAFGISGCMDSQCSADTKSLAGGVATGAMSFAFIKALEAKQNTSWESLIRSMRQFLKANGGFQQVPQLSSSRPVDLKSTFAV